MDWCHLLYGHSPASREPEAETKTGILTLPMSCETNTSNTASNRCACLCLDSTYAIHTNK